MDIISLTTDGIEVKTKRGNTVLQVAREAGIYIPTLCAQPEPALPSGACRLCVVEIEGQGFPSSCVTIAREGMVVHTNTALVREIRAYNLKVILGALPSPRLKRLELQKLADYLGVKEEDVPPYVPRNLPIETEEPLFIRDHNRCILCGRCVRMCKEVRGVGAIDFVIRDGKIMIGPSHGSSLKEAGCRFCEACVEICPTAALVDKDGEILDRPGREVDLVPCMYACPAGVDVPRYIQLIAQRRFAEAAAVVHEKVPFPGVLGRVCFHPCESKCRRSSLNEPIAISVLKRVAAERDAKSWRTKSTIAEPTGKRVAIVGSGPGGLTAGYYLAKLGHSVTVFDALPEPGGMMRVGIPEYRLPQEVLDAEISDIKAVGVKIRTNTKVESLDKLFKQGYDAVLLAIGAHKGIKMGVTGEESPKVIECIDLLRDVKLGKKVKLQGKVAVVGGGNAAVDAARTAIRIGAAEVTIIYRRSRAEMPAYPEEVDAALDEGIKIIFLAAPNKIVSKNGALKMECIRMKLGEPDATGRKRPIPIKGSEFTMDFDTIIASIGQTPDIPSQFGVSAKDGDLIQIDSETLATSRDGVFAAGDAVKGPASVIEAIASGRKAAVSIDRYLGGSGVIDEKLVEEEEPSPCLGPGDGFADMSRVQIPCLTIDKRRGFSEVTLSLSEEAAVEEAKRCLECNLRLRIAPPAPPPAS